MTRDEIIRRGESAGYLLANPSALAACEAIQAECAEAWANSGPHQQELRDDAYRLSRSIKLVRLKLETWAAEAATEIHNSERDRKVSQYA